jgi:tetratricopeptide (TPR) repeat protein
MPTKTFSTDSTKSRTALIATAIILVLAVAFVIKWSIANTASKQNLYPEVADLNIALAPNDPQTHFARAALYEKSFLVDDAKKAVREYEIATSLSPSDFRFWSALARARERAGDTAGAEAAYKKALELAPNYSNELWAYGNVLIRMGKTDQGFEFIRAAAQKDKSFAAPAVAAAWQEFPEDLPMLKEKLGESPNANSAAAVYFARLGRFSEAREFWTLIDPNQKKTNFRESGEELLSKLLEAKRFRFASEVANDIGKTGEEVIAFSKVANGGFETDIRNANTTPFEWVIGEGLQPHIGFDEKIKHGGNRSLGVVYDSPNGLDFRSLQEFVPLGAERSYRFEVYVRADIKSDSSLKWEIADASTGQVLASTETLPDATDWISLEAEFSVAPETEAVVIRIARVPCANATCPTRGKIWFDDISLQPLSRTDK